MPCQMKLTLEEALILPPSMSGKYLNGDTDDTDEAITILTLSKNPLFLVAVTMKKSIILKHCPYNFFSVHNMLLSQLDRGHEISCTGKLSRIRSNRAPPPHHTYTFFSILVEDNDSITFHNKEILLDDDTKRLIKIFQYSIHMTRAEIEGEYYATKWRKRLEEEADLSNDASAEDNNDDSDLQTIVFKSKSNLVKGKPTPLSTQTQEVDELDEDSEEEQKRESKKYTDYEIDNALDQFSDDDDDFQEPIIVKPRTVLKKKIKTAPAKKSSGCGTKKNAAPAKKPLRCGIKKTVAPRRKRVDRCDKDDDYEYKPHKKMSDLVRDTGIRTRTRSGDKVDAFPADEV